MHMGYKENAWEQTDFREHSGMKNDFTGRMGMNDAIKQQTYRDIISEYGQNKGLYIQSY